MAVNVAKERRRYKMVAAGPKGKKEAGISPRLLALPEYLRGG